MRKIKLLLFQTVFLIPAGIALVLLFFGALITIKCGKFEKWVGYKIGLNYQPTLKKWF